MKKSMNKLILIFVVMCILTLPLIGCGNTDVYENDTQTDEENNEQNLTAGVYTEPLTGAIITIPGVLVYQTEINGQYGKGIMFKDVEDSPSITLSITVDEIYVDTIDEAYEEFGFNVDFFNTKLGKYTENYFMAFTKSDTLGEIDYTYDWVCLLTDGSVLHLTLDAMDNDPAMVVQEINIDFNDAVGELGLVSIYNRSEYKGSSPVVGIWENAESGDWFDCAGGLLFSIYDKEGNIIDCGIYDDFLDSLSGCSQSYSVDVNDNGLSIDGFDGVFSKKQELGVIPYDIPGGIPCEGTQASGESSGEVSEYLGKWENDTISCKLEINRGGINIYEGSGSYSNDSYTLTDQGNIKLSDGTIVMVDDNGGLKIEGLNGIFYPEGEKESVYVPYIGHWDNDEIEQYIWLQDGGAYSYQVSGSGIGGSTWSVEGKGILTIGGDEAHIDEKGNLVIDGCDGVFIWQKE
ncbi:MAG: hypothetical protein ACERKV_00930 [Clostridiaceae bacterium]